jgi:hypothetical protein
MTPESSTDSEANRLYELALTELGMLQELIARQEELRLKLRGWNLAVITGLVLAMASADLVLSKTQFAVVGLAVPLTGWFLEAYHNLAEHSAIRRARKVEYFLQSPSARKYDGPGISRAMLGFESRSEWARRLLKGMSYPRIALPHLVMVLIVVVVGLSLRSPSPVADQLVELVP